MNNKFNFVQVKIDYVDEALVMVLNAYIKERQSIPYLPDADFSNSIRDSIKYLFENGSGYAALLNNEFVGFLSGFKVDNFFGKYNGIYCPIYGHGVKPDYGLSLYSELYRYAADQWVKEEYITHAVTVFSHDDALVNMWFWQGFGLRCIDSIRQTSTLKLPASLTNSTSSGFEIRKAVAEDADILSDIHIQHNNYYRRSPVFMPRSNYDPVEEHMDWMSQEGNHEWVAYRSNKPIGIMRLCTEAESFISCHSSVMNIQDSFVIESERGNGVGSALLNTVQQWLMENGYPLCGVDYESINPQAKNFWGRYFTPYTYSLVRRIDEQILPYIKINLKD